MKEGCPVAGRRFDVPDKMMESLEKQRTINIPSQQALEV